MTKSAAKPANKTAKKPVSQPKNEGKPAETADISPELVFTYELMSISALSRMLDIDRATVRDRIEKAQIKPASNKNNEKLYLFDEKLETVLRQDELEEAKIRKLQAEADLKEHDLSVKRGEFASVAEFTEIVQKIFGRLYKNLAVQMPSKISKKLHDANSAAELSAMLKKEIAKEFDALRSDHTKYL